MIEQRVVMELQNERPVPEAGSWIAGEPSMLDVLGDPLIHAVLRRDGLALPDLLQAIALGRRRLSPEPTANDIPTSDAA
jgi:hypothetical protein